MDFLKKHPFAVEAYFENSTVLTFAIPKENLQSFIPPPLQLDTFQDKWAFLAVAMVKTKNLRPKGFPSFMGNNFFLIGYRIFVRYNNHKEKRLRGLYILKSETDKKKMEFFGNIFTNYKYITTDISIVQDQYKRKISSLESGFNLEINKDKTNVTIPALSPFQDWKEARRFAGPLPFTFTVDKNKNRVLIIEGVRQNWKPVPIEILNYRFDWIENLKLGNPLLASAFEVENVPYHWKKGTLEK